MSNKPKRRWYQFSLLALLLLTTVISVPLGWLAYERNKVRQREAAIAAIKKRNGSILFNEPLRSDWLRWLLNDTSEGSILSVDFDNNSKDADLADVAILTEIEQIGFFGETPFQVTDAGLVHLANLTKLTSINLDSTQVTDAGLVHLANLTKLTDIHLDDTQVTDAGLVHLAGLKELCTLALSRTKVTDTGLARLAGLTKLEVLELDNTKVTDAGLAHLSEAKQLNRLYLRDTHVTRAGVITLQRKLPHCEILWDGSPLPAGSHSWSWDSRGLTIDGKWSWSWDRGWTIGGKRPAPQSDESLPTSSAPAPNPPKP